MSDVERGGKRAAQARRHEAADAIGAIRFTPDGSAVAYRVREHGIDSIQIQPLDGSPRRELLRFSGVTVGAFRWSPDGSLLYFTSERDGFRCIWAQRLNRDTKVATGDAFAVQHFHTSRRSLMNVGLGPLEISVTGNALVFNLGERTGNIWRVSRQ